MSKLRDELIERVAGALLRQREKGSMGMVTYDLGAAAVDSLHVVELVEALQQATLELGEAAKIINATEFAGTASLFADAANRHRAVLSTIKSGE